MLGIGLLSLVCDRLMFRGYSFRSIVSGLLSALLLLSWPGDTSAMRPDRIAKLRRETVDMFYHGFDNYMKIAFPEDEVN